jgi:hypothetical protein
VTRIFSLIFYNIVQTLGRLRESTKSNDISIRK